MQRLAYHTNSVRVRSTTFTRRAALTITVFSISLLLRPQTTAAAEDTITLLDVARMAGSAKNVQPVRMVVVTDPDTPEIVIPASSSSMFTADTSAASRPSYRGSALSAASVAIV